MLAYMPRAAPPQLDFNVSNSAKEKRRNHLYCLPSTPMTSGQSPVFAALPVSPSPAKKPKLTLNTSDISPVFGKGSTSLRLETLSATSPTVRNTFQNRHHGRSDVNAKSTKPALTPLSTKIDMSSALPLVPSQISLPESADPVEWTTSPSASVTVSTGKLPYNLPFDATSILKNGPIAPSRGRSFSFTKPGVIFPSVKKVGFKAALTEEIETTKYTLKHSDIESIATPMSTLEVSSPGAQATEQSEGEVLKNARQESSVLTEIESDRKSNSVDIEHVAPAVTPVAGRSQRHNWVWTLAPIQVNAPIDVSSPEAICES